MNIYSVPAGALADEMAECTRMIAHAVRHGRHDEAQHWQQARWALFDEQIATTARVAPRHHRAGRHRLDAVAARPDLS